MYYFFEPNLISKIYFFLNKFIFKKNYIFSQFIYYEKNKDYLIDTKNFVETQNIAREIIYKSVNHINNFDEHTKNYIRKSYELGDFLNKKQNISLFDFIVFLKKNNLNINDKNLKRVKSYYKNLFINTNNFFYTFFLSLNFIFYLLNLFKFFIYFLFAFFLIIISKKNITDDPEILFLRKKNYPDQNFNRMLKLFNNDYKKYNGTNILFKNNKNNDELNNLNNIKGSINNSIKSFIKTLFVVLIKSPYFLSNLIHPQIFYSYLRDTFISIYLSNLRSKVFFGILVDKPIFILLDRNKNNNQFTYSLNESFFYKPLRTFDYVHLDKYYSMNHIDQKMINEYGGNIKKYHNVPFFRKNILNSYSNGISDDLKHKINQFKKTILLAPIQYDRKRFLAWNEIDYKNFHYSIINLTIKNPEFLFIYKEKKGELDIFSNEEIDNLKDISNLYLVRSKKPRYLKFNQFEDLLKISDCLISQSHTSTTIWQAINEMKYVIAINNCFEKSFLSEFGIETKLSSLNNHFEKWTLMNSVQVKAKLELIREKVNINNTDGLSEVYSDLILYKKKKNYKFFLSKKTLFIFNLNLINKIKIIIFKIFGYQIFYWSKINKYGNCMEYPPSSEWYEIRNKSKNKINTYLNSINYNKDHYLKDYLKKFIALKFDDFYSFFESVNIYKKENSFLTKYLPYSKLFNRILNNDLRNSYNYLFIFKFCSSIIVQYIIFLYYLIISFTFSEKINNPNYIYLRKKIYPCPYFNEFNINSNVIGAYIAFSSHKQKFDINFLNNFRRSAYAIILSMYRILSFLIIDYNILKKLNLRYKDLRIYIVNNFISSHICELEPKIIFGVLIDEPIFILLNRYKKKSQFVCSLNESFMPLPQIGFDYNNFDLYFSQNKFDNENINPSSGNIKKIKIIGYYRNFKSLSKFGLSSELLNLKKKFTKSILITSINTSEIQNKYTIWSNVELNAFVSAIINLSKNDLTSLFILKEKKDEYSYINKSYFDYITKAENIFLIRSKKPRLLKYNTFEDLILNSNLLISMSNYSNTFWQALYMDIPCISLYYNNKKTFMSNYKYYEVNLNNLSDAYWYHLNEYDKINYISEKNIIKRLVFGDTVNPYLSIINDFKKLENVITN